MRPPFELFVALRHLRSSKRERFISVATLMCLLGVALGVMALIVVLSVMNGFQETLKEKILSLSPHVMVLRFGGAIEDPEGVMGRIADVQGIERLWPAVSAQALLSSPVGSTGAVLRGIGPEAGELDCLRGRILRGSGDLRPGEVWIGVELAGILGVDVGDTLRVLSPAGLLHPFGRLPRVKEVRVGAVFQSGMYDYDSALAIMPIGDLQAFLSLGKAVTHIAVRVRDIYRAPLIAREIQGRLGPSYYCRDWIQMNRNLFYALRMERRVMFILLSLIVAVAAFSVIAVLMMTVMEKRREIAILRSMGARRRSVVRVFLYEGLLIGLGGTVLGTIGGLLVAFNAERIAKAVEALLGVKFLPADVYYITEVPSRVNPWDVLAVVALAIGLSLLSALYPAWKASKLDPVEVLRYE